MSSLSSKNAIYGVSNGYLGLTDADMKHSVKAKKEIRERARATARSYTKEEIAAYVAEQKAKEADADSTA